MASAISAEPESRTQNAEPQSANADKFSGAVVSFDQCDETTTERPMSKRRAGLLPRPASATALDDASVERLAQELAALQQNDNGAIDSTSTSTSTHLVDEKEDYNVLAANLYRSISLPPPQRQSPISMEIASQLMRDRTAVAATVERKNQLGNDRVISKKSSLPSSRVVKPMGMQQVPMAASIIPSVANLHRQNPPPLYSTASAMLFPAAVSSVSTPLSISFAVPGRFNAGSFISPPAHHHSHPQVQSYIQSIPRALAAVPMCSCGRCHLCVWRNSHQPNVTLAFTTLPSTQLSSARYVTLTQTQLEQLHKLQANNMPPPTGIFFADTVGSAGEYSPVGSHPPPPVAGLPAASPMIPVGAPIPSHYSAFAQYSTAPPLFQYFPSSVTPSQGETCSDESTFEETPVHQQRQHATSGLPFAQPASSFAVKNELSSAAEIMNSPLEKTAALPSVVSVCCLNCGDAGHELHECDHPVLVAVERKGE